MNLNLANPIVFFDLETTGVNIAKDRIVEISVLKVYPNGKEEQRTIRVNPEMHIPEEASKVHGIHDEDVKDCPVFKSIAKELARYIEGCMKFNVVLSLDLEAILGDFINVEFCEGGISSA